MSWLQCCCTEFVPPTKSSYAVYDSSGSYLYSGPANKDFVPSGGFGDPGKPAQRAKAIAIDITDNEIYVCPEKDGDGNDVNWITRFDTEANEVWTVTSGAPTSVDITLGANSRTIPAAHFMDSDDSGFLYVWDGATIKQYDPLDGFVNWTYDFESDRGASNVDAGGITRLRCFGSSVWIGGIADVAGTEPRLHLWEIDNTGSYVQAFPSGESGSFSSIGGAYDDPPTETTSLIDYLGDFVILSSGASYLSFCTLNSSNVSELRYINSSGDLLWQRAYNDILVSDENEGWYVSTDDSNVILSLGPSLQAAGGDGAHVIDNTGSDVRTLTNAGTSIRWLETSTGDDTLVSRQGEDSRILSSGDSVIATALAGGPVSKRAVSNGIAIALASVVDTSTIDGS
ncbi:MAG: hypothetical protein HUJ26_00160 [Planctomycetaceae bacterium]|nr:hypothetical protein [Planctomycetaceae bacterium]